MSEPIFWLALSLLLVAVSLTAVLVAAFPAFRELARAARSAEKLFDTLSRELPPTLESIRLTGIEITDLTGDVSEGVQSAGRVVQHVDQSILEVKQQAKRAKSTTRSFWVGVKAAWKTLQKPPRRPSERRFQAAQRQYYSPDNEAWTAERKAIEFERSRYSDEQDEPNERIYYSEARRYTEPDQLDESDRG